MESFNKLVTIESVLLKGIEYFLTKHSNKVIDAAKTEYLQGIDGNYKEFGFDNWFLCDYKFENKDMMTIYKQNQAVLGEDKEALESIQGSFFSYYEVFEVEGKSLLKDLFTKADYKVQNSDLLADGTIVAARLYPSDNQYFIEILETFDAEMHKHVTGAVLGKYNEFCAQHQTIEIQEFIKTQSLLLYKFVNVFKNVSLIDSDADEEFMVYQSDYVFEDRNKVIETISTEGSFEFIEDEDGEEIYSFTHEEHVVELVIKSNKLEIEAPTEAVRTVVKTKVETVLSGYITFVQDVILNIDDIL